MKVTVESKKVELDANIPELVLFTLVLVVSFEYRKQKYEKQKLKFKLQLSRESFGGPYVRVLASTRLSNYSAGLSQALGTELSMLVEGLPKEELASLIDEAVRESIEGRLACDRDNNAHAQKTIDRLQKEIADRTDFTRRILDGVEKQTQEVKSLLPLDAMWHP
jgi:hypothetical protein